MTDMTTTDLAAARCNAALPELISTLVGASLGVAVAVIMALLVIVLAKEAWRTFHD